MRYRIFMSLRRDKGNEVMKSIESGPLKSYADQLETVNSLLASLQGYFGENLHTALIKKDGASDADASWAVCSEKSGVVCICGKRDAEGSQELAFLITSLLNLRT